jgi:outer membrane protein
MLGKTAVSDQERATMKAGLAMVLISGAGCLVPSDAERLYPPFAFDAKAERGWIGDRTAAQDAELPEPRYLPDPKLESIRSAPQLDLEGCFRLAVARKEQLRIIGEDMVQSALAAQSAMGSLLPAVALNANYARQGGSISFEGISFAPDDSWGWGVSASMPIFNGLREIHAWNVARALARSQVEQIQVERRILYVATANAYIAVLVAEKEIQTREESLRLQEERLREVRARAQAGEARRAEVLLTEANAARDRASLEDTRQRLRLAWNVLGYLTGIESPRTLAAVSVAEPAGELAGFLAEARSTRAELQALRERIVATRSAIEAAWGEHLPSVRATANYYGRREGIFEDIDWDLLIEGSVPVFRGGQIEARVATARSELRKAQEQARAMLRQIELEVRQGWSDLRSTEAQLEAARAEREAAQESDRAVRAEYQGGEATNLEVLAAQDLLLQARIKEDTEALVLERVRIRLLAACGRLPPRDASPKEGE